MTGNTETINRVILIGNGFDIAHGLKTSYNDFLNSIETKALENFKNNRSDFLKIDDFNVVATDNNVEILVQKESIRTILSQLDIDKINTLTFKELRNGKLYTDYGIKKTDQVKYQGSFRIIHKNSLIDYCLSCPKSDWGGFENTYKDLLLSCSQEINLKNRYGHYFSGTYGIKDLNNDLDDLKEKFINYLQKVEKDFFDTRPRIHEEIYFGLFGPIKSQWGVSNKNATSPIGSVMPLNTYQIQSIHPNRILIVNFNYTSTIKMYNKEAYFKINGLTPGNFKSPDNIIIRHIHGQLNDIHNNPIILGFGNEFDIDENKLENLNDEYLRNIKSILYTQTGNYKDVISFLDENKYDIVIYGHSCSMTDRTLLNTIFEHDNCISIQPFLYDKNNTSIYNNIYRCFNNKKKMRSRVVDKTNTLTL